MQNQTFPQNSDDNSPLPDYLRTSNATPVPPSDDDPNAAANLVRQKLAAIFADEPDAQQEAAEADAATEPLSKHQQYMRSLQSSGKSWAEIQNAWHAYYEQLSDHEKHEVWQEFYAASNNPTAFQQHLSAQDQAHAAQDAQSQAIPSNQTVAMPAVVSNFTDFQPAVIPADYTARVPVTNDSPDGASKPSIADIKKRIRSSVSAGGNLKGSDHLKSLGFGLATGAIVVFIFLFGFFNELFISPLIQPSRKASETPIIVSTADAVVGTTPKVIVPKINVEIPVDYSQTTTDETAIEGALDKGVVHYPTTVMPGQAGNTAFFGHSSNNIFNPGKYKFAFVLLHKVVEGDTFYLTYNGKSYAYQVISRQVVDPTDVGVLGPVPNETATATLITCDPPGTSLKRLVVVGRQISPDPSSNTTPSASTPILATTEPTTNLPGNGPTLWSRLWHSIF